MNCEDTRQKIPDLVRGDLADDAARAVRAHAGDCPPCARHLEQKRQIALMIETVEADRDLVVPPEAEAERLDHLRRTRVRRLGAVIVAATLAAGATVVLLTRPWEGPARDPYRPVSTAAAATPPLDMPGAGRVLRLVPGRVASPAGREAPTPLRDLAAASDVVVLATPTDIARERVQVRVAEVLHGLTEALDRITVGGPHGDALEAPEDWTDVSAVLLFLRRDVNGAPLLVAGADGCVPVGPPGGLDEAVAHALLAGGDVPREELDRVARAHGAAALLRLETECDLRGRLSPELLAELARDLLQRVQTTPAERARHALLRQLACVLRVAESPPLDVATLRDLHAAFLELPAHEAGNRVAHLAAAAVDDRPWALQRLREMIDVGAAYARTRVDERCPPAILAPLRALGAVDPAAATRAANEILLEFPARGMSYDVLDAMLDVAPGPFGEAVTARAAEETWDDPAHVLSWYGDLVARSRSPRAPELLRSLIPWLVELGSVDRRARFVSAVRRAGPDGPARGLLPEITAWAQDADRGERLAFLLRCRLALGGDFEPLRERAATLLADPTETSLIARLDLIRAVQEATGEQVLAWRRPTDAEIEAAAAELARRLR